MEFKTLDSVLQTHNKDTGEKSAVGYRCIDMDRMVPTFMGVSKVTTERKRRVATNQCVRSAFINLLLRRLPKESCCTSPGGYSQCAYLLGTHCTASRWPGMYC